MEQVDDVATALIEACMLAEDEGEDEGESPRAAEDDTVLP
jgi:hypothetical protein